MKKLLLKTLSLGLILSSSISAYGQQVENGSFETYGEANTYSLNDPQSWGTLNFDSFGWPQTTEQSTTAPFHGLSNVLMTTKAGHSGLGLSDTIGGAIFYKSDVFVALGTPHATPTKSMAFNYKNTHLLNDSGYVYVALRYWNGTSRVTVGDAFMMIGGVNAAWTSMNLPIEYYTNDTPDTILIMAQSSAGSWPFYITNDDPIPGTQFEMDAVVLCDQLSVSFSEVINERTVTFTSASSATGNGGMGNLSWDFGDANTSTDANPTHEYLLNGVYTVNLTVTDSCGNDSTFTSMVTIDSDLAINEFEMNSDVSVYPNPSNGIFSVDIAFTEAKNVEISIIDVAGRTVSNLFSGVTEKESISVNEKSLESGTYYLVIQSEEDGSFQKTIIVNK